MVFFELDKFAKVVNGFRFSSRVHRRVITPPIIESPPTTTNFLAVLHDAGNPHKNLEVMDFNSLHIESVDKKFSLAFETPHFLKTWAEDKKQYRCSHYNTPNSPTMDLPCTAYAGLLEAPGSILTPVQPVTLFRRFMKWKAHRMILERRLPIFETPVLKEEDQVLDEALKFLRHPYSCSGFAKLMVNDQGWFASFIQSYKHMGRNNIVRMASVLHFYGEEECFFEFSEVARDEYCGSPYHEIFCMKLQDSTDFDHDELPRRVFSPSFSPSTRGLLLLRSSPLYNDTTLLVLESGIYTVPQLGGELDVFPVLTDTTGSLPTCVYLSAKPWDMKWSSSRGI